MNSSSDQILTKRLAIIGGGVSGLSAAYFLDDLPNVDITLYERGERLGGNAITVHTHLPNGKPYAVDPVAYLFVKPRYPLFTTWIKQMGIKIRELAFENYILDAYRSRGVLLTSNFKRILTSPEKSLTYIKDLYSFKQVFKTASKLNKAGKLPDELLMKDFVAQVKGLRRGFLEEIFYPLMSFAFHCDAALLPDQPCGSTMRSYAAAANDPAAGYCIDGGITTYIDVVHQSLKKVKTLVNSTVTAIALIEGEKPVWAVTTADGNTLQYDQVLLAIWPHQAAELLKQTENSKLKETTEVLSKVELAHCLATIHNDTTVMPIQKENWVTYSYKAIPGLKNVVAAIWSGQAGNAPVFTQYDWNHTEASVKDAANITQVGGHIHAINYHVRTPPRPTLYAACNHIDANQGVNGLWFTGCYLRGTGFHEDGLTATIKVLEKMVPDQTSMLRMRNLLQEVKKNNLNMHF